MTTAIDEVARILGPRARRNAPLGALTTYRVGGTAALSFTIEDDRDLELVHRARAESDIALVVLGRGSNMLVADGGFSGLVVALGERFAEIELGDASVRAGGATSLPVLARTTAAAGLRGLEWAVGVPGSVGGAIRMNAGGHGSDVAACLLRVRVVDLDSGKDEVVPADSLALAYRQSSIGPCDLVAWAEFALRRGEPAHAEAEVASIVRWRRANQPGGQNAGSVFTNPDGDSAGRLIDAAGLKGFRVGTARVSEKHANFIQADEGGVAADVLQLMREVASRVRAASGVRLHPEVRLVGFPATGLDPWDER